MTNDTALILAIVLIAGLTFASRIAGPLLMTKMAASPKMERYLDALSVSMIAALVASSVAQTGWREAVAVLVAASVMLGGKNALWAMAAGMVLAAGWSGLLS